MLKFLLPITLLASSLCLGAQVKHHITMNDSVMIFSDGERSEPCFKLFIRNDDNEIVKVIRARKISIDKFGVYYFKKDLLPTYEKNPFANKRK
jgi:hypothetical protein